VDEVIVVDANSTDATRAVALELRPDDRIVQQRGRGKGAPLQTGFEASTGDYVVMIDADGSMSPQEIPHFLHFLDNGYDFVKGSRFIEGGGSLDFTRVRRAGNLALMRLANRLYGTHMTDFCYGYAAFRRKFLDHLNLSASGFDIEAEMTVHAILAGLRIAEVPSLELPRRYGTSNLNAVSDGSLVLRAILRDHHSGLSGRMVQSVRRARRWARGEASAARA
jgi:glycosyltransferase involved in cell wall biosynthesis